MRKNLVRAFLFSALILPLIGSAQSTQGVCGTHGDATIDRLIKNKEAIAKGLIRSRGAVIYLPVKYHLVAKTDGSGRVSEIDVLEMHCKLNEMYADQEVQFYIKDGFNYINNDAVYDRHQFTQGTIMNPRRDLNAINVFIVNDATPQNQQAPGTVLGYYLSDRDWIVIKRDQARRSSQTLPHEMGHFLSLSHPHRGWDSVPFDAEYPGWPNAPAIASNGNTATEKVDGSNCSIAGDLLCDTKADYNFGYGWQQNCNYAGGAKDPAGVTLDPDETLIMSYFSDQCVNRFTEEQKAAIAADIASTDRTYIRSGYTPPATSVTSTINTIYPEHLATVAWAPTINIDWEDVPGATHYIVQFANNPSFFTPQVKIVDQSSAEFTLDVASQNRRQYWRVRPYNPYYTCNTFGTAQNFFPSTSVSVANTIPFVDHFSVAPNPVNLNSNILVRIDSKAAFDATVSIIDLTGKSVRTDNWQVTPGENNLVISNEHMFPGMYLILIDSNAGRLRTKFMVNR